MPEKLGAYSGGIRAATSQFSGAGEGGPKLIAFEADVTNNGYVIFNESTKLERDDDDDTCPLEGQDDFVPLRKVKYDYLTPRQLPCGNRPSTTVWSSPNDIDYTADELLALARDQRLAREADRRRPESPPTPPHSPLDDDV